MPSKVTDVCSLFMDLGDPFAAVAPGDWVATSAGSRYLVVGSRRVRSRIHQQRNRWQLTCSRLERGSAPPPDVVCWELRWYPRRRRQR